MRFYSITKRSNFIQTHHIKSFHSNMFHGLAERDGRENPHDTNVLPDTDSCRSLEISRTARGVPDISEPSTYLVVSERIAKLLEPIPGIRLFPVVFKRLVDVEYQKGDLDWGDKWGWGDPRELLKTLPDVPAFHETIGRYFEVQTWRLQDVVERYPEAQELCIKKGTPPRKETMTIRLSPRLLTDFPMIWECGVLLNEQAFGLLAEDIDRDFFIVREFEL